MKRNNIWKVIVSSVVVLLPILFGLIVWDMLPEQLAIHWGADGIVDGFANRLVAVGVLPVVLLALHLVCVFVTPWTNRAARQSQKVLDMTYWICPAISLYTAALTYATAFGMQLQALTFTIPLIGIGFIAMGNYLPKCTRNRTMGIKLVWTLASEENWNYTHRLAGKVWVISGIVIALLAFLPVRLAMVAMFVAIGVACAIPVIASYLYRQKQKREGTLREDNVILKNGGKGSVVICVVMAVVVAAILAVVMFTGDVGAVCNEDSVTLQATYHKNVTIAYSDIEAVEYRDDLDKGSRVMGYGSPRLSLGTFQNEEFGSYTLYTYTGCDAAVILTVKGEKVAVNGQTTEDTIVIYDTLMERMGN